MNFILHPEAEVEFYDAINYFDECEDGLGKAFGRDVFDAISRIVEFPDAWAPLGGGIRRCLCKRFPYSIIFEIYNDEIFILAVMSQSREPDYWTKRLA